MTLPFDFYDLTDEVVRARLDRAKRQGAWLWPDIPVADWRKALESIQRVAGTLLIGRGHPHLMGEPSAIALACYTSGMGPLLGWWHAKGHLEASDEISPMLALHLEHNRCRSRKMRDAASSLTETLEGRGIGVVVLKGADTASRYFPEPETRPASDIDLLVEANNAAEAEDSLRLADYRLIKRSRRESDWRLSGIGDQPRSLMLVHAEDPWSVDLHVSLNVELAAGAGVLDFDAASLFQHAPMETGFIGRRLSQPLLLVYLAAHASTGLHNLSLLRMVELHLVIAKDEKCGELDWNRFLALCRKLQALAVVWPALKLTEDLARGTVPEYVLRECSDAAPSRVRAIVNSLTPATAHRVGHTSIREHFMWAAGVRQIMRQLAADLIPGSSWQDIRRIYTRRVWQVARGSITL